MVIVHESIEELAIQGCGAILAFTAAPPEPVAVDLVIGSPQNGDTGVAQLFQIAGDDVDLRAPALMERGAGREHLVPFEIGKVALDAIAEGDRLIVGGANGVPGEGDDRAIPVLAHGFGDQRRAGQCGVLIGAALEAEILAKDGRVLAGQVVGAIGPVGDGIRVVVLAGKDVMSGNGVQVAE